MINISATLESGQLFRYWKERDGYRVVHGKHSFYVDTHGYSGIKTDDFNHLFRLDDNYEAILSSIRDAHVGAAITAYPGLRVLRQDPWECLVSFLCSSATNIPRIKRDLNAIARTFGSERDGVHLFPQIGEIDDVEKLRNCGTGFRAKYIAAVNDTVTAGFLNKLRKLRYEDAHAALMELPGVGPKIADCVLLFSCDHLSAFPIDTWMEKVLVEDYGKKKKTYAHLSSFARERFGDYAGYAQQFLYHWKRNEKENK